MGKEGPSESGGMEGAPEAWVRKVRTEEVCELDRLSGRRMKAEYAEDDEGAGSGRHEFLIRLAIVVNATYKAWGRRTDSSPRLGRASALARGERAP